MTDFDVTRDPFWVCNNYHEIDGKVEWRQWHTYSRTEAETVGCPQHGVEGLHMNLPEPRKVGW